MNSTYIVQNNGIICRKLGKYAYINLLEQGPYEKYSGIPSPFICLRKYLHLFFQKNIESQ